MGVLPGKYGEFGVGRCELVKHDGLTTKSGCLGSAIQYLVTDDDGEEHTHACVVSDCCTVETNTRDCKLYQQNEKNL